VTTFSFGGGVVGSTVHIKLHAASWKMKVKKNIFIVVVRCGGEQMDDDLKINFNSL
jgi:acetyl-CoA carboxylase beta subunit